MRHEQRHILDAIDAQGNGLRLHFLRAASRWAHRLLAVEHQQTRLLLESVEGQQQAFPPSPALQQLELPQVGPTAGVALLIGMAGKNHWSVSVEAFPRQTLIRFDAACRTAAGQVGSVGSTYTSSLCWEPENAGCLVARTDHFVYRLTPRGINGQAPAAALSVADDSQTLRVVPAGSGEARRWCYELCQAPRQRP